MRRSLALAALAVAVSLVHLWLAGGVLQDRLGSGADQSVVRRIEVAFVRDLQPVAAVSLSPPAPAPVQRRRAEVPARKASQAEAAPATDETPPAAATPPEPEIVLAAAPPEAAPVRPPEPAASASPPELAVASAMVEPAASGPASGSVSAPASALAFDWPPSTRLSYTLTGHYRGPVDGQARVEWLRTGTRYQVHLDVSIGPAFAPLVARRMSSEGDITEAGLRPRRYEEETRVAFRAPRQVGIVFGDERIRLPSGIELLRPAGVQDSASQFVQMTWMFTMQPALLEPGRSVELPLALPRRVEPWTYDVRARETLYTPMGEVQTVHVKPRRESRPGSDLTAEFWVAPSLQYLPVRIVIRQDADTYVDLLIDRLPQQAAAPGSITTR